MDSSPVPTRFPWFAINVGALCIFAPWATYWFQQHLQLYFTEIVVVGGAISLWVLVRGMWAVLEKTGKVDAWEYSRKLLSLPDVTGLLAVGIVVFLLLWFHTGSLYLQYQGAPGEGEYTVEVVRMADASPLIGNTRLNAEHAVVGRPVLWQSRPQPLQCRILAPVKYQSIRCDLVPGQSTRIQVPGSFPPREFHLLRLIPIDALYRELVAVDGTPTGRFDLEITRGKDTVLIRDIRRQVIYTGANDNELPIILGLDTPTTLEQHVRWHLLAKGFDTSTEVTTAVLVATTRPVPSMYLQSGDHITIRVTAYRANNAAPPQAILTLPYIVTNEKVQSLWLTDT